MNLFEEITEMVGNTVCCEPFSEIVYELILKNKSEEELDEVIEKSVNDSIVEICKIQKNKITQEEYE